MMSTATITNTRNRQSRPCSESILERKNAHEGNLHAQGAPVRIESLTVKADRVIARIAIDDVHFRYTTPAIAERAQAEYPTLARHACVNARGKTFGAVMNETSTAHLLEHLVIEMQIRSCVDEAAVFVGTTEWIDEQAGIACVQVSFEDDLNALRAFNKAAHFLNSAVIV